ncbi:MAG: DUF2325 domain-containing protein [Proteobacteria bacterium]|nr:DUF2325 domain-containing protein [Pseudomonadota bacterium]
MNRPAHLFQTDNTATTTPAWMEDAFPPPARLPAGTFVRRRTRLHELDGYFHCSLIGTCLSTADLRKLIPKYSELDRTKATDLDIHHMAVRLSGDGGPGAKALNKLLDTLYAADLKRFQRHKNDDELYAAWAECLRHGDVPGAYWALMTHPATSLSLRQLVFGEVHMLSHLVGAANRADIRRLLALEEDNAQLKEKVERQQARLQELAQQHSALERQHAAAPLPTPADTRITQLEAQVHALEAALQTQNQQAAHHEARANKLEERLQEADAKAQSLKTALTESRRFGDEIRAEFEAIDRHLTAQFSDAGPAQGSIADALRGKRILYVGGRPHSSQAIHAMVKTAGGELILHDGGIEDRRGLFASSLANTDLVVFPTDCVGHNAVTLLKRACERHGVPYRPLRSAGLASFAALAAELARTESSSTACPPPSRFCLHHG